MCIPKRDGGIFPEGGCSFVSAEEYETETSKNSAAANKTNVYLFLVFCVPISYSLYSIQLIKDSRFGLARLSACCSADQSGLIRTYYFDSASTINEKPPSSLTQKSGAILYSNRLIGLINLALVLALSRYKDEPV
jgi:hypothetical protein